MKNTYQKIKHIVESNESRNGRIFDWVIKSLIFLSIVEYSVETSPELSAQYKSILEFVEYGIVGLFTFEYFLRIVVADKPFKFIFSFFGVVDLLAFLPFYISFGVDLRGLRIFRALRLIRIFKLIRYNHAIRRFAIALKLSKDEFILFIFISALMLYLSAAGIHYFENEKQPEHFSSIFDSFWWAVCTLTTVGYGDMYPITLGGRIFTMVVLIIGMSIISVPAGIISSALSKAREIQKEENELDYPYKGKRRKPLSKE